MQAEHHVRTIRQGVDDTTTRDEMPALPRWESFPQEDRLHLVSLILQTARRQIAARPAETIPSR